MYFLDKLTKTEEKKVYIYIYDYDTLEDIKLNL